MLARTDAAFVPLKIRPLGVTIGAEISGIDLRQPLSAATVRRLHDAWLRYAVLVFHDQPLSDAEHILFSRYFGELELHPSANLRSSAHPEIFRVANTDEQGRLYPANHPIVRGLSYAEDWHVDFTYHRTPSAGSILRGLETTREGGVTMFASLTSAYESMPASLKARIDGRLARHSYAYSRIRNGLPPLPIAEARKVPPVMHQLVRPHSITRRPSILFNRSYIEEISGYSCAETEQVLRDVIEFAAEERFVYEHVWSPHDLIMWDNRAVMHRVTPFDAATVRRVLHRTTMRDDWPEA